MKRRLFSIAAALLAGIMILASAATLAHSGRTDSKGGHKDNKNKSGLGSYHYHHGESAHLHPGGVCPYDEPKSTPKPTSKPKASADQDSSTSKVSSKSKIRDAQEKLNELGYDCAKADGRMGSKTIGALKAFQKDNNLKVTGTLTDATYELLMEK